MRGTLALGRERREERDRERALPSQSADEIKRAAEVTEFNTRLAAHKAAQDASVAPQNAPERTEEPASKNFTVDDEIEAREAKFDAAVEEYNAGTTAAPDTPAPDDAPSPSEPGEPSGPSDGAAQE
jgi:hypothetical protein